METSGILLKGRGVKAWLPPAIPPEIRGALRLICMAPAGVVATPAKAATASMIKTIRVMAALLTIGGPMMRSLILSGLDVARFKPRDLWMRSPVFNSARPPAARFRRDVEDRGRARGAGLAATTDAGQRGDAALDQRTGAICVIGLQ
jgi:hypothetical protein